MITILFLGLLIGMQHAMEADHIAAVSSIVSGERSARRVVRHGVVWGIGHSLTIMLFAGGAIWFGMAIGHALAAALEIGVGAMLVLLGAHVIYRVVRDRVHFHVHRHAGGAVHVHAHSHRGERGRHDPNAHDHEHGFPLRTLLVGLMHGMAGSAALLVLSAAAAGPAVLSMSQVAAFAIGSILGMTILSAAISIPLARSAQFLTGTRYALEGAIGLGTVGLGAWTIYALALQVA